MKIYSCLLSLLITASAFGQKLPEVGMNVRIIENNRTIVAEIRPSGSDPAIDVASIYYWYGAGLIHQTQGGYSGKLLNGIYKEYYLNKNLKEQGTFIKGLKQGTWKAWSETGKLQQLFTYKHGLKSGTFNLYDDEGNLIKTGNYAHNQLNGKVTGYDKGAANIVVYKNGQVVSGNKTSSFWHKINIFKKHGAAKTSQKKTKA